MLLKEKVNCRVLRLVRQRADETEALMSAMAINLQQLIFITRNQLVVSLVFNAHEPRCN